MKLRRPKDGILSTPLVMQGVQETKPSETEDVQARIARLKLEKHCAETFLSILGSSELTLVMFDLGEPGVLGATAYKTTLERKDFITTLQAMAARWRGGKGSSVLERLDMRVPALTEDELRRLGDDLKRTLLPNTGFAAIVGSGMGTQYISSANREDVGRLFDEIAGKTSEDAVSEASAKIADTLRPLPEATQREILQELKRENEKDLLVDQSAAELEARARLLQFPPNTTTAQNVEALVMAYGYFVSIVGAEALTSQTDMMHKRWRDFFITLSLPGYSPPPTLARAVRKFKPLAEHEASFDLFLFAIGWFAGAFPRLEIGHKLAASLCLTDVPADLEVRAPWRLWSLVVPNELLTAPNGSEIEISRLWLNGTEPLFIVLRNGELLGMLNQEKMEATAAGSMLMNLARGACLALANPEDFRKHRASESASSHKSKRSGPPDLKATQYMLSAPVSIDLRDEVRAICLGKRHGGGAPKVQFVVRGHWRNQAHGPRSQLRKTIWIQPFWKGPEESRVLLRSYKLEKTEPTEPAP